jgi:hypothetical protein
MCAVYACIYALYAPSFFCRRNYFLHQSSFFLIMDLRRVVLNTDALQNYRRRSREISQQALALPADSFLCSLWKHWRGCWCSYGKQLSCELMLCVDNMMMNDMTRAHVLPPPSLPLPLPASQVISSPQAIITAASGGVLATLGVHMWQVSQPLPAKSI